MGIEQQFGVDLRRDFAGQPLLFKAFLLFFREKRPCAVFFDDVGNFFGAKDLGSAFALADADIGIRILCLKTFELFEGQPSVVLIFFEYGSEHELDKVGSAVLSAGDGAERHSHCLFAAPAGFPFFASGAEFKHGLGNAFDELVLTFSAYLESAFLLLNLFAQVSSLTT